MIRIATRRPLLHEGQEVATVDHQQLAIGHGAGVGGAGLAIEQGDLAEDLARADQVEDDFAPVLRRRADLHRPLEHGEQ